MFLVVLNKPSEGDNNSKKKKDNTVIIPLSNWDKNYILSKGGYGRTDDLFGGYSHKKNTIKRIIKQ